MMANAPRRRLLFISNGHGEDSIAAAIIAALPDTVTACAYPMIGAGAAYANVCPIVGPRAALASQGWRNVKGSLRRDIATGGLMVLPPAWRFLRASRGQYDHVVVVGDMVGVLFCLATGNRNLTYLDVYKTGAARLYSFLEVQAIKRTCSTVFCRADNLAATLRAARINAHCVGNVMMDTLPIGDYDAAARRSHRLAVTLLPGSRALTAESFCLQVDALRRLRPDERPDVFLALAGGVDLETMARQAGLRRTMIPGREAGDLGTLSGGGLTIHVAQGNVMGNLLAESDLVLSQAGTATIQALGLGKPAITCINPRDRRSRFRDEQNLFGEARVVVEASVEELSAALRRLLTDDSERNRLGVIGRERIGPKGALAKIIASLSAA